MQKELTAIKSRLIGPENSVGSGNTPDGVLHIGALREELLAGEVSDFFVNEVGFNHTFVVYDMDGLKGSSASAQTVNDIGRPLFEIPCPIGCCQSLAEHNLRPYLDSLSALNIKHRLVKTSYLYLSGAMSWYIEYSIKHAKVINEILLRAPNSSPFIPVCKHCGKFCYNAVLGLNVICESCGARFVFTKQDKGKLRWEVEWAVIWKMFNVVCEPIGSLHSSQKGKSFDKASDIAESIFSILPPVPIVFEPLEVYEINCAYSKEAQCCRRNVQMVFDDWAKVAPPEMFKSLILDSSLNQKIKINIKEDLLTHYETYRSVTDEISPWLSIRGVSQFVSDSVSKQLSFQNVLSFCNKGDLLAHFQNNVQFAPILDSRMFYYAQNYLSIYSLSDLPVDTIESRTILMTRLEMAVVFEFFVLFNVAGDLGGITKKLAIQHEVDVKVIYKLLYWTLTGLTYGPRLSTLLEGISISKMTIIFKADEY